MKPLLWMADTKKVLLEFPREVRRDMGFALSLAEVGDKAEHAKPLTEDGLKGVIEIRDNHATDTYRVMYIAKLRHAVYVLHAFKKKSTSGIATPRQEIQVVKDRLKRARELDEQLGKEEKGAAANSGDKGGRKKQ